MCTYIKKVKEQGRNEAFETLIADRLKLGDPVQKIVSFMTPYITEADVRRVATEQNLVIGTTKKQIVAP